LREKAKSSSYWSKAYKFLSTDIIGNWRLSTAQINRLEKIRNTLDKLAQASDSQFKIGIKVRDRLNFRSGTVYDRSVNFPQGGILRVKFGDEMADYAPNQVKYELRVLTEDEIIDGWLP